MLKTGIFGGSFNPIHNGHVAVAETALSHFTLDEIVFIPVNIQPLKTSKELTSFNHRFEMVKLAISSNRSFAVSDIEGERGGISFTIDTLRQIIKEKGVNASLYMIVGSDSVREIPNWRQPEEILRISELIIYPRGGFTAEDLSCLAPFVTPERLETFRANLLEMPVLPESGTEIRHGIAAGEQMDRFLHPDVAGYIRLNKLYQ